MSSIIGRRDDGVHSFFAARASTTAESLMNPEFLDSLRCFLPPDHRERRFTLAVVLWLGVYGAANASLRSMEAILAAACAAVEGSVCLPLGVRTLTQSGWSRAKARLSLGMLKRVWRHWVEVARAQAGEAALFGGMRLVALDRKTVTMPEALWGVFGAHQGNRGEGPAQAELLVAYDVCVRTPLEFALGRVHTDEKILAQKVLRSLRSPALLLVDHAFYSIGLFTDIRAAGHHFLTRMRSSGSPHRLRSLGPNDGLYEIRPNPSYWRGTGRPVPPPMTVRIVRVQWRGFRPVRLVTTLTDPATYSRDDLIDLYHRRWHVETFFRELQEDVAFEHWHTRRLKVLYAELLFHFIYVTAVRAQMAEAATAKGVLPGSLSFGRSALPCMHTWCRIGKSPPARAPALHDELIAHLATLKIDVRPDRSFERDKQKRRKKSRRKKLQALEEQGFAA